MRREKFRVVSGTGNTSAEDMKKLAQVAAFYMKQYHDVMNLCVSYMMDNITDENFHLAVQHESDFIKYGLGFDPYQE